MNSLKLFEEYEHVPNYFSKWQYSLHFNLPSFNFWDLEDSFVAPSYSFFLKKTQALPRHSDHKKLHEGELPRGT